MIENETIGFGGGCHWCTEGVFQSLIGINDVKQGWISSFGENIAFSEAILIEFQPEVISLETLVEIHLHTHSSTSKHSMRDKYRSAIYFLEEAQKLKIQKAIENVQNDFKKEIVTSVLPFADFKLNKEDQLNYFYSRPDAPFCQSYIHPKLDLLLREFSGYLNHSKIRGAKSKT